ATTRFEQLRTSHVALCLGTAPHLPPPLEALAGEGGPAPVLHSADYLDRKQDLLEAGSVTVVGSGQSAAEVYRDLLAAAAPCGTRMRSEERRVGKERGYGGVREDEDKRSV